ncbi:MAG TPA: spore coat U domain-containing protein [Usitatibacter sp.]|jgi:spore coat protein U-like protein|nr:spore coat U domain-containing protein [Usitatibacter sp.]
MNKKTTLRLECAAAALMAAAALNAHAGTATANLTVSATISPNCTITTSSVAFGAYDPIAANSSTALDNTGTVSTTCTSGSSPTITLDQGANPASGSTASTPLRQMKSGSNVLGYQLYSDSTRSTVWADTGVATPAADGTLQANTVYGRIAGGQNQPVGSYSDTVVATVTF